MSTLSRYTALNLSEESLPEPYEVISESPGQCYERLAVHKERSLFGTDNHHHPHERIEGVGADQVTFAERDDLTAG